jgi:hypothetical protein
VGYRERTAADRRPGADDGGAPLRLEERQDQAQRVGRHGGGLPLTGERWSPAPCPPLATLLEPRLAPFLDHPRAIQIAGQAGATDFCARTGGRLVWLHLRCYGNDPARLLWRLEYWGAHREDEAEPWRAPEERFRVALDAVSGDVVVVGAPDPTP